MRYFIILLGLLRLSYVNAKEPVIAKPKKQFYVTWGYTRATYSKSSIHFKNLSNTYNQNTGRYDSYDFTVHNVVAHDRPDFDGIEDIINISVPQYVYRIGCMLNKKWGIEFNFDHTKYVVDDYQVAFLEGRFNDTWVNEKTLIDPETFLHFEHSDGANFCMLNAVRNMEIAKHGKYLKLSWVVKPGAGLVIPRTDVTLFGEKLNNRYKVSGWIVGVETGFRLSFLRHGFLEFVAKGSFADYVNAFVMGKHHGSVSHNFFTGQVTGTIGLRFN